MSEAKNIVKSWVKAFNAGDVDRLVSFYDEDAINHQVAYQPLRGRHAIREMFKREFARATMVCVVESLFEDGHWVILEWSDPIGVRGCGFFQIKNGLIVFQRGYFDQLSFLRAQGIPIEEGIKEDFSL